MQEVQQLHTRSPSESAPRAVSGPYPNGSEVGDTNRKRSLRVDVVRKGPRHPHQKISSKTFAQPSHQVIREVKAEKQSASSVIESSAPKSPRARMPLAGQNSGARRKKSSHQEIPTTIIRFARRSSHTSLNVPSGFPVSINK